MISGAVLWCFTENEMFLLELKLAPVMSSCGCLTGAVPLTHWSNSTSEPIYFYFMENDAQNVNVLQSRLQNNYWGIHDPMCHNIGPVTKYLTHIESGHMQMMTSITNSSC